MGWEGEGKQLTRRIESATLSSTGLARQAGLGQILELLGDAGASTPQCHIHALTSLPYALRRSVPAKNRGPNRGDDIASM